MGPQASRQSTRGRLPSWEPYCRVSPRHHRREASKRPRSPFSHSNNSPKWRHEKEIERGHHHRCYPSPYSSSGSSRKGSFNGRIGHRAEQQLDECNQRLEELSHRITNQLKADYDSRPSLSHRIMEEPISTQFHLLQLDPYDSTTDPLDHLKSYKVLMQVQRATDSLLCIAFPTIL